MWSISPYFIIILKVIQKGTLGCLEAKRLAKARALQVTWATWTTMSFIAVLKILLMAEGGSSTSVVVGEGIADPSLDVVHVPDEFLSTLSCTVLYASCFQHLLHVALHEDFTNSAGLGLECVVMEDFGKRWTMQMTRFMTTRKASFMSVVAMSN